MSESELNSSSNVSSGFNSDSGVQESDVSSGEHGLALNHIPEGSSKGKKRQREEAVSSSKVKKVRVVNLSFEPLEDLTTPVLVRFPGIIPPEETEYQMYVRKEAKSAKLAKQRLIFGETERVELIGRNYTEGHQSNPAYCKYLVGVYDKETHTVTLKEAPLFHVSRTVKANKGHQKAEALPKKGYLEARKDLGKAFGTKKTIQRIINAEKNVVNSSMLGNTVEAIVQTIAEKTSTLPTKEQIKAEAESDRPIPPYDPNVTQPSEVYKLKDIVTETELESIHIQPFLEAKTLNDAIDLLPYKSSSFIKSRLPVYLQNHLDAQGRQRIRILLYVSYMMAFQTNQKQVDSRGTINKALKNPPEIIITSLYERFTERAFAQKSQAEKSKMTPTSLVKLLSYMFALCLMLDGYVVETSVLAEDLYMPKEKVNEVFKGLGCILEALTKEERDRLGIPSLKSRSMKKAVLKAPPVFPNPPRKRVKDLSAGGSGLDSAGLRTRFNTKKKYVKSVYTYSSLYKKPKKSVVVGDVMELLAGPMPVKILLVDENRCKKSWKNEVESENNSVSKISDVKNMRNMFAKETSYVDSNTSEIDDIINDTTPRKAQTRTYVLGQPPKISFFVNINDNDTELVLSMPKFVRPNWLPSVKLCGLGK
ncbi:hypothetical protein G9A89_008992 [Geosiphon pyriformis]|nr:hypothetical protein G9A89_008992 [Geosiphon pyriformis]